MVIKNNDVYSTHSLPVFSASGADGLTDGERRDNIIIVVITHRTLGGSSWSLQVGRPRTHWLSDTTRGKTDVSLLYFHGTHYQTRRDIFFKLVVCWIKRKQFFWILISHRFRTVFVLFREGDDDARYVSSREAHRLVGNLRVTRDCWWTATAAVGSSPPPSPRCCRSTIYYYYILLLLLRARRVVPFCGGHGAIWRQPINII